MTERQKMLIKRCEDLKHYEYVFLTYYRSGTTMTKHIIEKAGGQVIHFHQLPMDIREKYLQDKKLILLIRDYKECIISNCWTRNLPDGYAWPENNKMSEKDIDDLFTDKYPEEYRAGVYLEHLEHFDTWPNKKILIRYEDIIKRPFDLWFLLNWMGLPYNFDIREELRNVKYDHRILSDGRLDFHSRFVGNWYYINERIKEKAGDNWKYIKHYEL